MPMAKSSLTKNKDFQRLSKPYGAEDAVYFFNRHGEPNFFGRKILALLEEKIRVQN